MWNFINRLFAKKQKMIIDMTDAQAERLYSSIEALSKAMGEAMLNPENANDPVMLRAQAKMKQLDENLFVELAMNGKI